MTSGHRRTNLSLLTLAALLSVGCATSRSARDHQREVLGAAVTADLKPLSPVLTARSIVEAESEDADPTGFRAECLDRAMDAADDNAALAEAAYRRALLQIAEEQHEDAVRMLTFAIAHNDRHAQAHALLGQQLCRLGRYEEALPSLRFASDARSTDRGSRLNLALALAHLDRFTEADETLGQALQLDSGFNAGVWRLRVVVNLGLGQLEKARRLAADLEDRGEGDGVPASKALNTTKHGA